MALLAHRFVPLATAALLAGALSLAGCATTAPPSQASASASLRGDAARPTTERGWVRSELYFGLGLADAPREPAEARWRAFLDREVTPRFPDGLSVLDAYGQWQSRGRATPERLRSKVLVVLHPDTAQDRERIEAIRVAWKRETGDQSVLWSWQPVGVSF